MVCVVASGALLFVVWTSLFAAWVLFVVFCLSFAVRNCLIMSSLCVVRCLRVLFGVCCLIFGVRCVLFVVCLFVACSLLFVG